MPVVRVTMFFKMLFVVFFVVLMPIPGVIIIINGSWMDMTVTLYINHRWWCIMAMRSFHNNAG